MLLHLAQKRRSSAGRASLRPCAENGHHHMPLLCQRFMELRRAAKIFRQRSAVAVLVQRLVQRLLHSHGTCGLLMVLRACQSFPTAAWLLAICTISTNPSVEKSDLQSPFGASFKACSSAAAINMSPSYLAQRHARILAVLPGTLQPGCM
jgi:hypothetical protein